MKRPAPPILPRPSRIGLPGPAFAPTPRDVVMRDGSSRLLHFRPLATHATSQTPLLLIPSLLTQWYVLDWQPGISLVANLVDAGFDTYVLDWGQTRDEDHYVDWDALVDRVERASRRIRRRTGAPQIGMVGYCMGATLGAIAAAQSPRHVKVFANIAGPIDFDEGGPFSRFTDQRWFPVDDIADAGNVSALQIQAGFDALRPTRPISRMVTALEEMQKPQKRRRLSTFDAWRASLPAPFPAEAYRTYIRELYQDNALAYGRHFARGRRVELAKIQAPTLAVAMQRDEICPPASVLALLDLVGSEDREAIELPGGHVGGLVGRNAPRRLYPAITEWLKRKLWN